MDQQSEQLTINQNMPSSNPTYDTSSRVFEVLKNLATDSRTGSTATDRKIAQLKAQRKRLRENAKKIKQRIREQTEKLRFNEQEIYNIDFNINKLQSFRDNEEEMDMK
jgi:septal ring factor EnvC (AmiA/AmiB activator)